MEREVASGVVVERCRRFDSAVVNAFKCIVDIDKTVGIRFDGDWPLAFVRRDAFHERRIPIAQE